MIDILQSHLLIEQGFNNHGFTTGVNFSYDNGDQDSIVANQFKNLKKQLNTELPLVQVVQIHGRSFVDAADKKILSPDWTAKPVEEGDSIICSNKDAFVAVRTADCAPVLIACPDTGQVAAVHAGWKGLSKGIIKNTVKELQNRGSLAINLIAAIGPCICENCYEVDEDVARRFPESSEPVKDRPGKFMLELGNAVEASLIIAGLTSMNIDRLKICTSCGNQNLFSYRASKGNCGRQLSFIGF